MFLILSIMIFGLSSERLYNGLSLSIRESALSCCCCKSLIWSTVSAKYIAATFPKVEILLRERVFGLAVLVKGFVSLKKFWVLR